MNNPISKQWKTVLPNKIINNGKRIALLEKDVKYTQENAVNIQLDITHIKADTKIIKQSVLTNNERLNHLKEILNRLNLILKWIRWIAGALGAVLLSVAANFIYSLVTT